MPRSYGQLLPSVERRLSAWISVTQRPTPALARGKRPTITISRQFGCEGFPLAEQLKPLIESRTGETWHIYDKALLELVSERDDLPIEVLSGLGDPTRNVDRFGFLVPHYVAQSDVFEHIHRHIARLAVAGNAIIVGRGGAIITQKFENCFHFRLEAGLDFRVASMAKRLDISAAAARTLVRKNELAREEFIKECLGASPADRTYYDAVFNNARQGVAEIASAIVAYVVEAWTRRVSQP